MFFPLKQKQQQSQEEKGKKSVEAPFAQASQNNKKAFLIKLNHFKWHLFMVSHDHL